MIPFHQAPLCGPEFDSVTEALASGELAGDGPYAAACSRELKRLTGAAAVLMTPSGTAALELAALLLEIRPGDEVILPSFTFPSTANAFALRGAVPVFVDIRPQDMNLNTRLIEAAVTPATRAIAPMHYGGMACRMEAILALAEAYGLAVVEDAAQGLLSAYRGRSLGIWGDLGCLSFHNSKHFTMGEGGALLLRDSSLLDRAEIIRQKGADIDRFRRGQADKYRWQGLGSSYVASELNTACLLPQLRRAEQSVAELRALWASYDRALRPLAAMGLIQTPCPLNPEGHNAQLYYLKTRSGDERQQLADWLRARGIGCASHYQPLHSAPAGQRYGRFVGEDRYTSQDSSRLLRLPLWRGLSLEQLREVVAAVADFYQEKVTDHG